MRGHATNCSDAIRTTPSQCQCLCQGAFHGGPHTERATAILIPEDDRKRYSKYRVTRTKGVAKRAADAGHAIGEACTDYIVTDTINELIHGELAQVPDDLRKVLGDAVGPFVAAILDADLDDLQSKQIEAACLELHLLCSLCVEVLRIAQDLEELTDNISDGVVAGILGPLLDDSNLDPALRAALHEALKASLKAVFPMALDPARLQFLRLIGMITCPNIADHPEIQEYCVRPLMNGWVSQAIGDWTISQFADASSVLAQRRSTRRSRRGHARP